MTEKQTQLEILYEKFEDLKEKAKSDCYLDKANLDKAFNVTNSLVKWITYKTEFNKIYRALEALRKKTHRDLYQFYQMESPMKLTTKDEYTLFIESDVGYVDKLNESAVCKEILTFIDSTIDILKNKQFEIKHILEWYRFKNGVS